MKNLLTRIPRSALIIFFTCLLAFTFTRGALLLLTGAGSVPKPLWASIFLRGLYFDLCVLSFLIAPFLVFGGLIRLPRRIVSIAVFIAVFALLFICSAEALFWHEFSTRFNFIAVDYLLYTQEVAGNVWESYPLGRILALLTAVAIGLAKVLTRWLVARESKATGWRLRTFFIAFAVGVPLLVTKSAELDQMQFSDNGYANELSGNGFFTFFTALRRNELDYEKFYFSLDESKVNEVLTSMRVRQTGLSGKTPFLKPVQNVVLISVESLSASFLGVFGSTQGLTPHLDRLANEGLIFKRAFATGTRTVRGLEALSLGPPPLPGQSVVRRPNHEHLTTLGQILARRHFATYFFYGGYGYFDNMAAYFSSNDYKVIDRSHFPANTIPFENIWGVADEALFSNGLTFLDQAHSQKQRFFAHFMTTSNHRPFTYPDGRIDIPSPGGRVGAVKYSDFAIGQFIENAKKHDWFDDTLFVIVADHCASVSGRTQLPVGDFHIPLIFYAPKLLKPQVDTHLVSQIDIPPSILEALQIDETRAFYGHSLFDRNEELERAFVSNYQELGYYKKNVLTVLHPKKRVEAFHVEPESFVPERMVPPDTRLAEEAAAYYQSASKNFKNGSMKIK